MTVYTENKSSSDVLRASVDQISVDEVTITGANLAPGTVVELSGTKWQRATETGVATKTLAVLMTQANAATGDVKALIVARVAAVAGNSLVFDSSFDNDTKKSAAKARLAVNQIVVR